MVVWTPPPVIGICQAYANTQNSCLARRKPKAMPIWHMPGICHMLFGRSSDAVSGGFGGPSITGICLAYADGDRLSDLNVYGTCWHMPGIYASYRAYAISGICHQGHMSGICHQILAYARHMPLGRLWRALFWPISIYVKLVP